MMPVGEFQVRILVPGVIDWPDGATVNFPTPDLTPAPMRGRSGTAGEAWNTPVLRLAGQDFRSTQ